MTVPLRHSPDLAWAAHLVSSWWGGPGPAPDAAANPGSVVDLLRRNGFPLLTLSATSPASEAMLATEPFRLAIQHDRDKMRRQQTAFSEIVAAWRNHGIPALFVKAMGPLPSFPYVSNNLDVLVPQARQDEARQVVRELRYVELRHIEEPNKFLFRRFHAGASAFDLHVHGRLEWHTEFVDSDAVWQRAAFAEDCDLALVPAAEDALLIALAHAAYENKAYKLIELAKLVYACRMLDVDWDRVRGGARRRGWLPGLSAVLVSMDAWERQLFGSSSLPEHALASARREMPARLRNTVRERFAGAPRSPVRVPFVESKRLFYEKMLVDPSQPVMARAREIWTHTLYGARVRLRLRSQRPLLIAFDGIDGSGKSAQAALLADALELSALRHRIVWTRGGSSRLLQPFLALAKRALGASSAPAAPPLDAGNSVAAREAGRLRLFRHPLVRVLWPWAIAAELGASWVLRIGWPLLRGEVVIADRYALSAVVELAARLDNSRSGGAAVKAAMPRTVRTLPVRLLRAVAPRPERVYWFDVPSAVALARKGGEESPEFLAAQAAVAPAIVRDFGAVCIDATQPSDVISDGIVTDALGRYEDGHRTLLNGLFAANPRPLPPSWLRPELARGKDVS
jgi:thymidylate kinase